jgi:hypothetical protein
MEKQQQSGSRLSILTVYVNGHPVKLTIDGEATEERVRAIVEHVKRTEAGPAPTPRAGPAPSAISPLSRLRGGLARRKGSYPVFLYNSDGVFVGGARNTREHEALQDQYRFENLHAVQVSVKRFAAEFLTLDK